MKYMHAELMGNIIESIERIYFMAAHLISDTKAF